MSGICIPKDSVLIFEYERLLFPVRASQFAECDILLLGGLFLFK